MPRMNTSRHSCAIVPARPRLAACARATGIDLERLAADRRHGVVTIAIIGQLDIEERARLARWCRDESRVIGERVMALFGN